MAPCVSPMHFACMRYVVESVYVDLPKSDHFLAMALGVEVAKAQASTMQESSATEPFK